MEKVRESKGEARAMGARIGQARSLQMYISIRLLRSTFVTLSSNERVSRWVDMCFAALSMLTGTK
jgi:hypothetical protein